MPAQWVVKRFRYLFRESLEVNGATPVGEMLSVSGYRGVETKIYDDENRRRTDVELENYRVVRPGQLVVNTMWMNYAGLGVSEILGHVSPAYRSYWISDQLLKRYAHYLLRSEVYVKAYTGHLTGIRPNSLQMSRDSLMTWPVLVPPLEEQRAIVEYLDRETERIDYLIGKQEELVHLLDERKRATVRNAMGGSADSEGTADRLGRHVDILSGFSFPSEQFSADMSDTPLLRGINVKPGRVSWDETVYWRRTAGDGLGKFELAENDVVVAMDQTIVNAGVRVAILERTHLPALLLQRVARIRSSVDLLPRYLFWTLAGPDFLRYIEPIFTGVSVPHLSPSQIAQYRVALPPASEQERVVNEIEHRIEEIDRLREAATRMVGGLSERRRALISAAVTGKLNLRGR